MLATCEASLQIRPYPSLWPCQVGERKERIGFLRTPGTPGTAKLPTENSAIESGYPYEGVEVYKLFFQA